MNVLHTRSLDGVDVALALTDEQRLLINGARVEALIFGQHSVTIIVDSGTYLLDMAVYQRWLALGQPYRQADDHGNWGVTG